MARDFTGGSNTTRLNRTLAAVPSAAFSVGCWCHMDNWVAGRTFVGTGTTVAGLTGLQTGAATAQRFSLKINCATTDMVVEVAAPATGQWVCVVAVYTNSLTATNSLIYTGTQSSPMASQAHVVDTNGSGAVSIATSATIGKNAAANTAIDGRIAQAFMVPWAMTASECERFRQGDLSVLAWRDGVVPNIWCPMFMGTIATWDHARSAHWTVTSTPTVSADPPVAFAFGPASATAVRRGG